MNEVERQIKCEVNQHASTISCDEDDGGDGKRADVEDFVASLMDAADS